MDYFVSFLEGVITFISPCLLPMLPVYISYFAGTEHKSGNRSGKVLVNALGFVTGFTIIFVSLGAFAGTVGSFLKSYNTVIRLVSGVIVILFGLNMAGFMKLKFLEQTHQGKVRTNDLNFFSSILFGIIFSIGWTPCVGAFLGSALMLAASSGESTKGILMLFSFSIGLGIPFISSAVLIDRLKSAFSFIKRHYHIINLVSGIFLIITGILMATGWMGYFLSLLTF